MVPEGDEKIAVSGQIVYLNVFVAVVQAFMKVPVLKVLAPAQKEPPFLIAQLTILVMFFGLTILFAERFRIIEPARAA